MTETLKQVVNMDLVSNKRRIMQSVQMMTGLWEIQMKPRRFTRSLSQNSYWWAAVVMPFTEWLRQEWADSSIEPEQAHEMLKRKILGTNELVNKKTGEVIEITRSSRTLDTKEFRELIDNAVLWLEEFCGLVILSPEMYFEGKESKKVLKYKPKDQLREQLQGSVEMLKNKQARQ